MRILHTADWQIGKPYASIVDSEKCFLVRQERIQAIHRIGEKATELGAGLIVVAGDLFDSITPEKSLVSATCAAIGKIGLPVYVIPGNHDHGGPGSVWEQPFFLSEMHSLSPNLTLLLTSEPVELAELVLLPCPLLRRHESGDPTSWLRTLDYSRLGDKPRVVIAHGSTQDFSEPSLGDDEPSELGVNRISLERLPASEIDYVALGDWHGARKAGDIAWYSGTPEPDRFPKGGDYSPGNVLSVLPRRGGAPVVEFVKTSGLQWHRVEHFFTEDSTLVQLEEKITDCSGDDVNKHLVRLELTGTLGMAAIAKLEILLEKWRARFLRLHLVSQVRVTPTEEEIFALTTRPADPLISRVAARLIQQLENGGESGDIARIALRELHSKIV